MAAKLITAIETHDAALAFARDMIIRFHAGNSSFGSKASRDFIRGFMQQGIHTVQGRMILVEMALAGEEDACAILRDFMLEMKSRRIELPIELGNYDMQITAGMMPATPSGPKRKNEILRNIAISFVIAAVCDRFGLKPTGHSARQWSACAIVGKALGSIGMALGYKAIETIWRTYGRSMHMPRGWVAAMGPLPPLIQ